MYICTMCVDDSARRSGGGGNDYNSRTVSASDETTPTAYERGTTAGRRAAVRPPSAPEFKRTPARENHPENDGPDRRSKSYSFFFFRKTLSAVEPRGDFLSGRNVRAPAFKRKLR